MNKTAKTPIARFVPRTAFYLLAGLALLALLAGLLKDDTSHAAAPAAAVQQQSVTVHATGRGSAAQMNLRDGATVPVSYRGQQTSAAVLQAGTAQPLGIIADDFNSDGAADVITAYNESGRGLLTLQFGNPEAYAPKLTETFKDIQAGNPPPSLLPTTETFEAPVVPDLLLSADFDRDGTKDLLVAARGGDLYLLTSDGRGSIGTARQIDLPGRVTALATGDVNEADGLTDVAVAISGAQGPAVLVYDGASGGFSSRPTSYALPAEASSIAIGRLDADAHADLAVASGSSIAVIHGRERADNSAPQSRVELINLSSDAKALAVGEFIWDREHRAEIAVLGTDGSLQLLQRGDLDARPFTQAEIQERALTWRVASDSPLYRRLPAQPEWRAGTQESFAASRQLDFRITDAGRDASSALLFSAKMSHSQTEDLVVLDGAGQRVNILRTANVTPAEQSSRSITGDQADVIPAGSLASVTAVGLDVEGSPVAALTLPYRPGGQDLVILRDNDTNVSTVLNAPTATINVDRTDDTAAASACTASANDCSLRGAVAFANTNAGTQINLASATYNLSISGGIGTTQGSGEGFSGNNAIGDLDFHVSGSSLIGTGAASSIVNQTTPTAGTPSNDRVMEVNPDLFASFTFTASGVKLSGGKTPDGGGVLISGNPGNVTTVTSCSLVGNQSFGNSSPGGAIFNIGGGNVVVNGTTFQTNQSGPSSGGAIQNSNVNNALGQIQITNSTFGGATAGLGNKATGAANTGGGCISTSDFADSHSITTSTFQNNTTDTGAAGGGVLVSASGAWSITSSTFTSNSSSSGLAGAGGGAIALTGGNLTVNNACTFNNNTTNGSYGGGAILLTSTSAGGHTISGGTGTTSFSGNTATNTAGGGGAVNVAPTTNVTLSKLSFTSNSTTGSTGGGALELIPSPNTPAATPTYTLSDLTFTSNTASNTSGQGGGLLHTSPGAVNMTNMSFSNNSSGGNGGGLALAGTGAPSISGTFACTGNQSTAGSGGGVYSNSSTGLTFNNVNFQNNTANVNGGALALNGSGVPTFSGTTAFSGNQATTGAGGAIYSASAALTLNNIPFSNNLAKNGGALGMAGAGAVSLTGTTSFSGNQATTGGGGQGGALYTTGNSPITATQLSFTNNTATTDGGAVAIAGGTGTHSFQRCTITGNSVTGSGGGGAFYINAGTVNVNFSRLVNNTAATATNGLTVRRTAGTASFTDDWWGNQGPKTNDVAGTVTTSPFLQLKTTASPSTITVTGATTLTASFLTDSANNAITLANLVTVIGLPVVWNGGSLGTISNAQTTIQSNGTATATYTNGCDAGAAGPAASGTATPSAAVDTNGVGAASITVNKFTSSSGITSTVNPSKYGQSVTFTATVSAGSAGCSTPTGSVQFKDGGTNLGSAVSLSSGSAQLTLSNLSVGNHTITADYSGDNTYAINTGNLTGNPQVVQKGDTTTGVTSTLNPSLFGQSVTFTATVAAVSPAVGVPTGTVQFKDGGVNLGSPVALTAGVATLSTSALGVGSHTITADYSGDGNFNTSNGSLTGQPQVVQNTMVVRDLSIAEGNNGSVIANVTVALAAPATSPNVTFDIDTQDGTAVDPTDYVGVHLTGQTLNVGELTKTIQITIPSDTIREANKSFTVNLSNASNAVITDSQGIVTIVNDDPTLGDFDGDGKTDVAVWQSGTGEWRVLNSSSDIIGGTGDWGRASLGDISAPGDYDGDGKTDIAIFRPSEGNWYVVLSTTAAPLIRNWGGSGDKPVPADYDGDGKTDFAVYRPSQGNWYVLQSSTDTATVRGWGNATDMPVRGDYDADGKSDIAVFRPSDGNWYIVNSSTNTSTVRNFGVNGDKPVQGDYDGDGKTDIAIFRPSENNWYILRSSDNTFLVKSWGSASDIPAPGNFDGDNKTDITIYRPSESKWYILNSATNTVSIKIVSANNGDVPAPSAYLP